MAVKASSSITLSSVVDVKATYRYYLLQSSTLAMPSKPTTYPPPSTWDDTEPSYTEGSTNSLYFVDLTLFSDDTWLYSEVSLSSSYEAAKIAYNKALSAEESLEDTSIELIEKIEKHSSDIKSDYEVILNSRLETYIKKEEAEQLVEDAESRLTVKSDGIYAEVAATIYEPLKKTTDELNGKLEERTKYLSFTVESGLTVGNPDSNNKIVIDDNDLSIISNNNVVQQFDSDGNALTPKLRVTQLANLFGYIIEMDDLGNVNCRWGGDE